MELRGVSLVGGARSSNRGAVFCALDPSTGEEVGPQFASATADDVETAAQMAHQASAVYGNLGGREKAHFLRTIAEGLDATAAELVARAQLETALSQARLQGEVARTSNQLRMFAGVVEEGSWVGARIDTAVPDRRPLPRPDIRSMLRPLGPVVVFGASNFPLAFSVAGGDTASALAAGGPVLVKAHPAHPGTSELVGQIIASSVRKCGLLAGVFSLLFDSGTEIGKALVLHPLVKAVGFTGSYTAGKALMDLAAQRQEPVPCFMEMSSMNSVFILPGALRERATEMAAGLHGSFTLGAGQFCTKPGLVFLPQTAGNMAFVEELRRLTASGTAHTLLTPGIAANYKKALEARRSDERVETSVAAHRGGGTCAAQAALLETTVDTFLEDADLGHEVFGPDVLVIHYDARDAMMRAAEGLEGHLAATLLGTEEDLREYRDLIAILERKAGRLIFNGFPTGVEVSHAMVHGGPYPATSDSRFTSVGSLAVLRFARPVCWQNFPGALLPRELQSANPLGILRMVNEKMTREAVQQ